METLLLTRKSGLAFKRCSSSRCRSAGHRMRRRTSKTSLVTFAGTIRLRRSVLPRDLPPPRHARNFPLWRPARPRGGYARIAVAAVAVHRGLPGAGSRGRCGNCECDSRGAALATCSCTHKCVLRPSTHPNRAPRGGSSRSPCCAHQAPSALTRYKSPELDERTVWIGLAQGSADPALLIPAVEWRILGAGQFGFQLLQ